MNTKTEIVALIEKYLEEFSIGKEQVVPLIEFVKAHNEEALIDRKNFTGHITTSAFIINETGDKLLLLKHRFLNRWLQPGGHTDVTDELLQASALREAVEETGISARSLSIVSNNIFDVNSHQIPANEKKNEPAHVHHDIRFLFKCFAAGSVNISKEELTDSQWVSFTDLANNPDFYWVEDKVKVFG